LTIFDTARSVSLSESMRYAGVRRWLNDDELFDLIATDLSGREWRATGLAVNLSGHEFQQGLVCRAQIHELVYRCQVRTEPDYSWFMIRGPTPLPPGPEVWEQEVLDFSLRIENREGATHVSVRSGGASLPPLIHWRVEETLFSATGRLAHWYVFAEQRSGCYEFRVRRRPDVPRRSRLEHPITGRFCDATDFEKLLARYLRFVLPYQEQRYHPLSSRIYQVFRSGTVGIFDEAVMLSVALESLAKSHFSGTYRVSADDAAELDRLVALTDDSSLSPGIRRRLLGSLNAMARPSAADLLRALVDRGLFSKPEFALWKRVRNAAAHGEEFEAPYERRADDNTALMGTLFKLVMQIIGYDGHYVDSTEPSLRPLPFAPVNVLDMAVRNHGT
jgi:hypothetical protein